jgi:hypothetical protein
MEYKASFDSPTKFVTFGVAVLFVIIGYRSIKALTVAQGDTRTILFHGGLLLFVIATFLICYILSIKNYSIDNNQLVIKKVMGERRISISDIAEIRLIEKGEMMGTIRTFGSGGLFGYYGKFYNRTLGSMTLYTTQRTNRIFIKTKSGSKIIISPDDLSLAEQLKSKLTTW